ncbi:MAG TPA: prephenate dehydrogenase [Anaerolineae bacterium]
MKTRRICIIGLGLMGGSLALALHRQVAALVGMDTDPAARQQALQSGVFERIADNPAEALRDADVVILATPVRSILRLLGHLPAFRPDGCLVLDLGSTKDTITQAMAALPEPFEAIGGHPLCGKETAGFAAATPDLYRDQLFILCSNSRTTPRIRAFALDLIDQIGARPLFLPATDHDRLVAATSHLPYVVAAVLMYCVAALDDERVWAVSASGFRDAARLAGSDVPMMLDILLTNREAIVDQIDQYQLHLGRLKRLLLDNDEAALSDWLTEARRHHTAYREKKRET